MRVSVPIYHAIKAEQQLQWIYCRDKAHRNRTAGRGRFGSESTKISTMYIPKKVLSLRLLVIKNCKYSKIAFNLRRKFKGQVWTFELKRRN